MIFTAALSPYQRYMYVLCNILRCADIIVDIHVCEGAWERGPVEFNQCTLIFTLKFAGQQSLSYLFSNQLKVCRQFGCTCRIVGFNLNKVHICDVHLA